MIKVFYGDDRVRAQREMVEFFGTKDYEVIEAAELGVQDLPSIFWGGSLLAKERRILLRDGLSNEAVRENLAKYVDTPHQVVLLETKLDKRLAAVRELRKSLEFREFSLPQPDMRAVFDIYRIAKRDGLRAVERLQKIQATEDPKRFCGLMAAQALRDFGEHAGAKEKRVLRELAELDAGLSASPLQPWFLVQAFLLRLASL